MIAPTHSPTQCCQHASSVVPWLQQFTQAHACASERTFAAGTSRTSCTNSETKGSTAGSDIHLNTKNPLSSNIHPWDWGEGAQMYWFKQRR
ncbi:hypothetical protein BaRGS_00000959 [Batillaria attramentaria]|uniref:Uncharacterized protein n=1 Tax=Batillaria attramentaria TaxID=370345 RepID=A0ABD0M7Q0_9CAEN